MKVFLLRGDPCPDRVSCPHLFATDRGTHIVQGRSSTDLTRQPGQAVVEIPLTLIPEIATRSHRDLHLTDRGTAVIRGAKVTDSEALAAIRLPADEDVVELAQNVLPTLEALTDAR
jgi:hypothetical protein